MRPTALAWAQLPSPGHQSTSSTEAIQRTGPIQPGDTVETFEARMHDAEHDIIVEAIEKCIG